MYLLIATIAILSFYQTISNFHDPFDSRFGYWLDVKKDDSLLLCVYKELGRSNKPKLGHFTSIEKRCDSEIAYMVIIKVLRDGNSSLLMMVDNIRGKSYKSVI